MSPTSKMNLVNYERLGVDPILIYHDPPDHCGDPEPERHH